MTSSTPSLMRCLAKKGINFTPTILLWDDCSASNCSIVLVNTLILQKASLRFANHVCWELLLTYDLNLQRSSGGFKIKYLSLKFVILFLIPSTFVTRGSAITILDDHHSFTLKETTCCCVSNEGFQILLGTIGGVRLFQILVLQNTESNNFKKLEVQLHCFSVLRQDPLPFPSTVNVTTS